MQSQIINREQQKLNMPISIIKRNGRQECDKGKLSTRFIC